MVTPCSGTTSSDPAGMAKRPKTMHTDVKQALEPPEITFILASLRCGGRIGPGGWREQLEVGAASVCGSHPPVAI